METEAFEQACRHHIKNNKHHWDYWLNDNNELEIPDEKEYKLYCVERCADWLAMACQHGENSTDWYNANKSAIIMPDYGFEICDEIMSKVPEKCDLPFRGVRGKIDESAKVSIPKDKKEAIYDEYVAGDGTYIIDLNDGWETSYGTNYIQAADRESAIKELKHNVFKKIDESFKVSRGGKGYLVEATMKQLKRKTLTQDPTRAKKSKNVQSKYIGISKYGVLNFETTSETHSGVKWYQEVQFPSMVGFMNIIENGDTIEPEDVKKAMASDNLKLSCDDPSFLYWAWKYMAWKDVYGLEKETRAPKRNNTRLQGALCKHLYSVIELLGENRIIDLIARDLNSFCKMKLGKDHEGYQDTEMINKDLKANQYDYNVEDIFKSLLTPENFQKYMDGTKLEDLGLSDKEMKDIDDAIRNMRSSSQFRLRNELEKQFAPAKRGRKITRDDIKLQVDTNKEGEV